MPCSIYVFSTFEKATDVSMLSASLAVKAAVLHTFFLTSTVVIPCFGAIFDADPLDLLLPLNDTTNLPIPSTESYWPESSVAQNTTLPTPNVSFLNGSVGSPKFACDGTKYGRNLKLASCLEAVATMADENSERTYGQRGYGTFDAPLPLRYLSCKP